MGIIVDSTVSIACENDEIGTNQKDADATDYQDRFAAPLLPHPVTLYTGILYIVESYYQGVKEPAIESKPWEIVK